MADQDPTPIGVDADHEAVEPVAAEPAPDDEAPAVLAEPESPAPSPFIFGPGQDIG